MPLLMKALKEDVMYGFYCKDNSATSAQQPLWLLVWGPRFLSEGRKGKGDLNPYGELGKGLHVQPTLPPCYNASVCWLQCFRDKLDPPPLLPVWLFLAYLALYLVDWAVGLGGVN